MDAKQIINGLGLYFYRVAESSQDAFWVRSPDFSSILYINAACESLWQIKADSLYTHPDNWLNPIHENDHERIIQNWIHYTDSPQADDSFEMHYRLQTASEGLITLHETCYPIFHKGRCIGFVGVVTRENQAASIHPLPGIKKKKPDFTLSYGQSTTDIFMPKHSYPTTPSHSSWSGEAAWKTHDHDSQNYFLDMMNHELRTPLNAVLGMAQILHQSQLSLEQKDQLDVIIESGKNLLQSLTSMLELTQLESNKTPLAKQPVTIRPLLQEALNRARLNLKTANVSLHFVDDPTVPNKLLTDTKRLQQVVDQLLANAVRHTHQGHVSLQLTLIHRREQDYLINLTVTDTGSGIPANKLHHIFQRFSQTESGYQRQESGIGLGLAVVKEIIHQMGGDISVTSTLGKGSSFSCSIPFTAEEPVESELTSTSLPKNQKKDLSLKVLVVEDNPINQRITQRLLEQAGCQVNIAECGNAAINSVSNQHDIILMDIGLPDIDGFETTARIRKTRLVSQDTPIIAMTAHVFEQDKERCFQVGMNEVIAKPILREELLDLLHRWSPANRTRKQAREVVA